MRAVLELPGHHGGGAHADAPAPVDELGRRPLQVRAVRRRHVLGNGGERPALVAASVAGHALVGCKAFDQRPVTRNSTVRAHEPVRHAVVVGLELDVVVDVDLGGLPAAQLEACGRQRLQRRRVHLLEGAAPAAGQLLEGALVQLDQQLRDGAR